VGLNELYNGLHIEADPTRPGSYRCISAAARAQGCVPINPFADYTPAQTNYVNLGSNAFGTSKLNNVVAYVTGSAYELPAGQVRTVLGAEYRSFSGFLNYDTLTSKGLLTGNQILDTDFNKTTTREVFGELYLPILADKEWAKSLSLEGAYRYSDVEGGGNYNTWKYGGDWEPITGLRFRAVKAKAVRAPTPGDLSGIGTTAGVVNDPCTASRRNSNPTRAANCAADGIPANYVPPLAVEQGVLGLTGGNPNLEPETSKTLTYGVVWEPTFLKNFSVSVDRFEIDVNKIITEVSRQLSVNTCYDTTNRVLCGAVTRGTSPLVFGATYVLLGVNERLENVAKLKVAGIDLNARYSFKAGEYGDVDLSLIATFYDKATLLPLKGEDLIDLLGQAGGSTDDQGWVRRTGNANIGWRMGPYNANWNIRYIGPADMAPGTTEAGYPKIGTYIYNNIKVGYQFAKASEIFFGITNLFDKQPPFFASGTSGTQALDTIPGYYDVFGRAYFLGARYKF
jgi:outer membrane receptor protein involved in Fe transport